MIFHKQKIKGVYLIEPQPFIDNRGIYRRHYSQEEFKTHSLSIKIAQANIVENKHAYTLRGFHYQIQPYEESKTLSCLTGAIYDIVVDLRPKSSTYLKWVSFELNQNNKYSLYIPPGCAHCALTLKDNTMVYYYSSQSYAPKFERGIRYNDPLFNFKWPHSPKYISNKDKNHSDFIPQK